jgi:hypothetical protein
MLAVNLDYVRIQSLAIVRGGQYLFSRLEQMWCGKYLPDAVYALSGKAARLDGWCLLWATGVCCTLYLEE